MEIRLTSEQEAFFAELAASEGRSTDELLQEAVVRFTIEKQAERMTDDEHAAALAEFRTSLDEADASLDRGEGIVIAGEEDKAILVTDLIRCARLAAGKPAH